MALHLSSNYDNVKLILSSRREDVLEEVAVECRESGSGNEVKVLALDLAEISDLPEKTKKALFLFGRVDVLVNNGGVSTRSMARNAGFDVDPFIMNVDFLSYVALTKALLPSFEQQGSEEESNFTPTIINISSVAGKVGVPVRTAYCAAKHAVMGWFEAFRIEQLLSRHPVGVTNVVLGSARTNVAQNAIGQAVGKKFGYRGDRDTNIDAGLEPSFVVERVLAAAYAGREEIWVAPRKETLLLLLNQYIPEMARVLFVQTAAKRFAPERRPSTRSIRT